MNPVRVGYIKDKIASTIQDDSPNLVEGGRRLRTLGSRVLSGMKVLDIGCGGGLLSEVRVRLSPRVLLADGARSHLLPIGSPRAWLG